MQTATMLAMIVMICAMFSPRVDRGSWAADLVDGVLDRHHNGVGLSFEVRLEDRKKSAIHKTVGDAKTLHL